MNTLLALANSFLLFLNGFLIYVFPYPFALSSIFTVFFNAIFGLAASLETTHLKLNIDLTGMQEHCEHCPDQRINSKDDISNAMTDSQSVYGHVHETSKKVG